MLCGIINTALGVEKTLTHSEWFFLRLPPLPQILTCQFLVSRKMKIAPLRLDLNLLAAHFEMLKANIEIN